MASVSTPELWYIRLPDGRVLRVRSTETLRRFLKSGRIPWDSRVRRDPDEAWLPLIAVPEFADLVPKENGESAPDATPTPEAPTTTAELKALGLRGLVEELFNAFESTLQRPKLTTAALTGLGIGITLLVANVTVAIAPEWVWCTYLAAGFVILLLFNICTSILAQLTTLELSRFHPAHFDEVQGGAFLYAVRLTGAKAVIGVSLFGLAFLLRSLQTWIAPSDGAIPNPAIDIVLNILHAGSLILEAICCPVIGYATLMMGPIYVVEDHSIGRGIYEWVGMLREHLGRIYLYQAIAFTFAAILALPVVLPILLAFGLTGGGLRDLRIGEAVPFFLLIGVALTPMLAYLLVAHVFIYLNLRYEFFYSARER